ncbi:MAG: replication-relaxation family protein [Pseudonocardiaceae bacterium]
MSQDFASSRPRELAEPMSTSVRQRSGTELMDWWSEQRCAAEWREFVRPDGFGRWAEDDTEVAFFVEFDGDPSV